MILNRRRLVKALALVIFVSIILYSYYHPSENQKNKLIELQLSELCEDKIIVSQKGLNDNLTKFYNGTTLGYSHRNTKVKPIPPVCLENLSVLVLGEKVSLYEYRLKKANEFLKSQKEYNNLDVDRKRYKLTLITPKAVKDGDRYKRDFDQNILDKELNSLKSPNDDNLEDLDFLKEVLNKETTEFNVPNLIHYVWFGKHTYRLIDYICMLSALKIQNPDLILVHGDVEPVGVLWKWLKGEAGNKLKFVTKHPPNIVFGKMLTKVEHQSDVARLQILLKFGGIYLDTDTMVLQSLNPLRKKEKVVMGLFTEELLANAAIIAKKDSSFLRRLFYLYSNFDSSDFVQESMKVPMILSQLYPDEVHVEETRMMRPNHRLEELRAFFHGLIDLTDHYTVHLNARWQELKEFRKERGRTIAQFAVLNTTYGEVARRALWGDPAIQDVSPWVLHPEFNNTLVVRV